MSKAKKIRDKVVDKRGTIGLVVAVAGATGAISRPDKVMQGVDALTALLSLF